MNNKKMNNALEIQARNVLKMDKEQQKTVAKVLGISSVILPLFLLARFTSLSFQTSFYIALIFAISVFFYFANVLKKTRAKIAAEQKNNDEENKEI